MSVDMTNGPLVTEQNILIEQWAVKWYKEFAGNVYHCITRCEKNYMYLSNKVSFCMCRRNRVGSVVPHLLVRMVVGLLSTTVRLW